MEQIPHSLRSEKAPAPQATSRRNFLAGLGSLFVTGVTVKSLYNHKRHDINTKVEMPVVTELPEKPTEATPERSASSEVGTEGIMSEIVGYSCLLPLKFNQIQFVDEAGAPLGNPVVIEQIGDIDPGKVNEFGLLAEGISPRWIDAARLELQTQFPHIVVDLENNIPPLLHVVTQFRAALQEGGDEPELVAKITSGEITRYIDIVNYFAEKPVVGAEHRSRLEYVQNEMVFKETVPLSIQSELRKIIPALCVQESGFNNDVTSKTGAKGIFQFMPDTWAEYENDPTKISSLKAQVEVAGQFFSDLYTQVRHWCGEDSLRHLEVQCESQAAFEIEVLVPLMVNAFNTGAKRMGDIVQKFVQQQKKENTMLLSNHPFDLFAAIIDVVEENDEGTLAAYGKHGREYVPRIYGHALAMQNMRTV